MDCRAGGLAEFVGVVFASVTTIVALALSRDPTRHCEVAEFAEFCGLDQTFGALNKWRVMEMPPGRDKWSNNRRVRKLRREKRPHRRDNR